MTALALLLILLGGLGVATVWLWRLAAWAVGNLSR